MRLTRLSISNYKGFKEFEINFDSDINVMYGVNGVGKSTIIRAITALLQLINTKNGVVRNLKIVKPEDYHDITHDVKLTIYANIDNKERKFGIITPSSGYSAKNVNDIAPQVQQGNVNLNIFDKTTRLADGTYFVGDLEYFSSNTVLAHHASLIPGTFLPVITSGQAAQGTNIEVTFEVPNRFAVTRGLTQLKESIAWFNKTESKEQQIRIDDDDINYRDPLLETARNAVKSIDPAYSDIKINRRIDAQPLTVCKNGKYFTLDSLSDGEGALICTIVCMAYLQQFVVDTQAVLLIDEIDNSLHPIWQTKIVKGIKAAFKNWQLIASSHSPFVWMELDRECVKHMVRTSEDLVILNSVDYAKGASPDSVVTEFFGITTVSQEVQTLYDEVESLISEGNGDSAREKIAFLRNEYGNLPILTRFEALLHGLGL